MKPIILTLLAVALVSGAIFLWPVIQVMTGAAQ